MISFLNSTLTFQQYHWLLVQAHLYCKNYIIFEIKFNFLI
nr:MAG TPA: hypothetical protein [Caudoviricetes sp.]